jgi:ankyrin repeat protein
MRKYIKLFEERYKDYEILNGSVSEIILRNELKEEIQKEKYDIEYIKDLVSYSIIDLDIVWEDANESSRTFLIKASELDRPDIIKILLDGGANPNVLNHNSETALMLASRLGKEDSVDELLHSPDIDVNATGLWDNTALMRACSTENRGVITKLLQHPDIEIDMINQNGRSALFYSVESDDYQTVIELLEMGANPNIQDEKGNVPILITENSGVLEALINSPNTDVNIQGTNKETALMIASVFDNEMFVQLLLNTPNINVNLQDEEGYTALSLAVERGHENIIEMLLNFEGIDTSIEEEYGRTAWDFATSEIRQKFPQLKPESR